MGVVCVRIRVVFVRMGVACVRIGVGVDLKVQNPLVFQRDITPTFLVQFWLAASQNDRTVCPQKTAMLQRHSSQKKN